MLFVMKNGPCRSCLAPYFSCKSLSAWRVLEILDLFHIRDLAWPSYDENHGPPSATMSSSLLIVKRDKREIARVIGVWEFVILGECRISEIIFWNQHSLSMKLWLLMTCKGSFKTSLIIFLSVHQNTYDKWKYINPKLSPVLHKSNMLSKDRKDILEPRLVSYWNPHFQIPLIIDDKSY